MKPTRDGTPAETPVIRGTVIRTYEPDANSWAWSTMQCLLPDIATAGDNPGREDGVVECFKVTMADPEGHGLINAFANPIYCVTADRPTRHFIHEARSAQHSWFSRVRKILHSSGRVKRELKKMPPIIRQLSHTGVLVLDATPSAFSKNTKQAPL